MEVQEGAFVCRKCISRIALGQMVSQMELRPLFLALTLSLNFDQGTSFLTSYFLFCMSCPGY